MHVREWTCGACGTVHDRDHNAARNVLFEGRRIVAAGRAETLTPRRAPLGPGRKSRHGALKQEAPGRVRRPRPEPLDFRPGSTSMTPR
ncbi:zinc ribbon domain-containing protein [Streptomyces mirabilis]|uniref:zinc ribbon domain-containing protein n=1 Tax=Streptomyces mirabilis TaxID=68239 RepID=UPI0036C75A21